MVGKIHQFVKEPDAPERLAQLEAPEEMLQLLEEKGI